MEAASYREAIKNYIREEAKPPDKFSHQARLYARAIELARNEGRSVDEDVLYAAAWFHDLGVFVGHRPEDPAALAQWDHLGYALRITPEKLKALGFPSEKIPAVLEAIRTHLPSASPVTYEGVLLRDADILEQLGAIGILRTVSKVGRDTRFTRFSDALRILRRNIEELPRQLRLPCARRLAEPRIRVIQEFLAAAEAESNGAEW